MDAWLTSSPFWGAGIYIGGSMASCRRRRPTPASRTSTPPGSLDSAPTDGGCCRSGWAAGLVPHALRRPDRRRSGRRVRRGRRPWTYRGRSRRDSRARARPARRGSTLWYDLEGGYDVANDDCRRSALRFLSGWTFALHDLGYRSGVYSSVSAGIHALDNADNLSPGSYEMPDQVWFAWYNGRADVDVDPQWVRSSSWEGQRVHQYEAHTSAAYGGVALTIDRNFMELDGGAQPPRSSRVLRRHPPRLRDLPATEGRAAGAAA